MRRRNLMVLIGLIMTFSPVLKAQNLIGIPPVEYQVELNDSTSEFFTVEVKGSSYERGFQHGKALRKVIRPTINRFKYDMVGSFLKALGSEATWEDYLDFLYTKTKLLQNAEEQVPDLVDEIRGIADGCDLPLKDVFAYNLNFDETFWVLEKMTGIDPMLASEKANYEQFPTGHCSHGSVWENGKASVGYTLDWTRHFEGSQTLIKHVKEDGTVLLMTTYAGTLIGHGINATYGYTFTPHSKFQLAHDVDKGLAQIFIYRKLIEANSVQNAIDYLHKVKPAAGLAYALTDKNGTRTFEVSANKIVKFKTGGNWMGVFNVARVNNDLSASYKKEFNLAGEINMKNLPKRYWEYNHDSEERYAIMEKEIVWRTPDKMTPQKWEEIFIQQPINKPVNEELPTSNLWHVIIIDEDFIEYHVSPGNPGNLPLEEYRFKYSK
ncbi:C45 family autoproteolytic acyltransferase/hydolase [Flammeovirga aprica]|uniref:Peptidase C45 hydrolase domain-containing protein n=1 Tax=Flammeovirga aprica JL-4 TaxID=694437 RepID=A0A7X9RUW1_9BACT|nr:C45 family peptidase [Flammeovirga aprica]NME69155.1 hypothetical protein [Flammeovirga aprica JL-4]